MNSDKNGAKFRREKHYQPHQCFAQHSIAPIKQQHSYVFAGSTDHVSDDVDNDGI